MSSRRRTRGLLILLLTPLLTHQIVVLSGCANIIPPSGGPRDSLPPVILKSDPPDSTRRFADKTITMTFDEYVQVQNAQQELIVSPTPRIQPVVTAKLRTITVALKDTLEPNTTYSINFGKAIQDVNEGNPLKNYTYVFSTGTYIDSLTLSGQVILAETGLVDSTLVAMLHVSADDSAVIQSSPRYIAKLDSNGRFQFRNLPSATFYLYAIKDESSLRRYLKESQLFAFASDSIRVESGLSPVTLYAYKRPEKANEPGTRKSPEKILLYRTNLQNNTQDLLTPLQITFQDPLREFDSTAVHLYRDSTYAPVSGYRIQADTLNQLYSFSYPWPENTAFHMVLDQKVATDTLGQQLAKSDTIHFTTRKRNEYGSLRLRLRNLDLASHPVLQFVQSDRVVFSAPMTSETFFQQLVFAGDYQLRILHDLNQNGQWDPGDFFHGHVQPELVDPVRRSIKVRANWENEVEITL